MTPTMCRRGIIHSLIWCLLSYSACFAEKLSRDQKAPQFARGSGGLILSPPFEGAPRTAASPPVSMNVVNEDGVIREEIATLKLVDGDLVRVVQGSYSYESPEGIPVSVNYVADENGYRAGFRLGAAALGKTGPQIKSGRQVISVEPGSRFTGRGPPYLPPEEGGYLPSS